MNEICKEHFEDCIHEEFIMEIHESTIIHFDIENKSTSKDKTEVDMFKIKCGDCELDIQDLFDCDNSNRKFCRNLASELWGYSAYE